ncbi:MAG: DUF3014 domain-containing protein [Rubrivivax sp.]
MSRRAITFVVIAALLLGALVVWLWPEPPAPPASETSAVAPPAAATVVVEPASAAASVAAETSTALPTGITPLAAGDAAVQQALVDLLGKPAVLQWLLTDDFSDRIAATVDNLGRGHVAPRVWPVVPSAGRFTVGADGRIAPENAQRYDAFVRQVEAVDPAAAALLYRRMLPQLQTSFEGLGYPQQRFDARLRAVIDGLLATPARNGPIEVTLTEVKGPVPSERPWVRYEFADPALEALPSGQKLMLRIGDDNRRRLQAWLRRFRAEISRP